MLSFIKRWPATVLIIEPREEGKGYYIRRDKGRRVVNEDGEQFYLLKKERQMTASYDYDKFYGNTLILYRKTKDELFPCEIKGNEIKPINQDMKFWLVQKYRYAKDKYDKPGFMQKYGMTMLLIVTVVLFIMLISVTFQGFEDMTHNLVNMGSSLNQGMNAMADALGGSSPIPSELPPL